MGEQTKAPPVEAGIVKNMNGGSGGDKIYFDASLKTVILSTELTAEYFGVTKQTLANWANSGCPKHKYGYYDLKAVVDYRNKASGLGNVPDNEQDVDSLPLQQQKLFYERSLKSEQAEGARLRNAILQGEYLERDVVVSELKKFAIILKRSLLGVGKKLSREVAAQVSAGEARRFDQLITDTLNDALDQMSVDGVYKYADS